MKALFVFLIFANTCIAQGGFMTGVEVNKDYKRIDLTYQDRLGISSFNFIGAVDADLFYYFEVKVLLHWTSGNWDISVTPIPYLSLRWAYEGESRIYTVRKRTPVEMNVMRRLSERAFIGLHYRVGDYPGASLIYNLKQLK